MLEILRKNSRIMGVLCFGISIIRGQYMLAQFTSMTNILTRNFCVTLCLPTLPQSLQKSLLTHHITYEI
jgi:hypothetical protein